MVKSIKRKYNHISRYFIWQSVRACFEYIVKINEKLESYSSRNQIYWAFWSQGSGGANAIGHPAVPDLYA